MCDVSWRFCQPEFFFFYYSSWLALPLALKQSLILISLDWSSSVLHLLTWLLWLFVTKPCTTKETLEPIRTTGLHFHCNWKIVERKGQKVLNSGKKYLLVIILLSSVFFEYKITSWNNRQYIQPVWLEKTTLSVHSKTRNVLDITNTLIVFVTSAVCIQSVRRNWFC